MNHSPSMMEARQYVQAAKHVAVLTGAGVSAESGVPTFRDAQTGLWERFKPEDLATEVAFRRDPTTVWDWYVWRRELVGKVSPNAAHYALAAFERHHPDVLTLITQNVDGLHQKAGSRRVLALHGNLMKDHWLEGDPNQGNVHADGTRCRPDPGRPPHCLVCGNLRRPSVVWFGEALPQAALVAAEQAALASDVMLVVGTSGQVWPAAGLAHEARAAGAKVVVLNTAPSALDGVADVLVVGPAAKCLPWLFHPST